MVHVQRAGQVDGDQPLPLRGLGLDERLEHIPAGVVDEHIHRAQALLHRRQRGIHAGALSDVAAKRQRPPARLADLAGDALGRFRVQVEHAHRRPGARKAQTGCAADTTATTGHDDRLAFKSLHSVLLSGFRCYRAGHDAVTSHR
ncbi:hypothetical protein D9M72_428520 [compost metagenome]